MNNIIGREKETTEDKQIVFFDEMPWMDNQKSGFLSAFEWFWNSWGSSRRNLVFIVCGSSISWLIDHIDKNKGGCLTGARVGSISNHLIFV